MNGGLSDWLLASPIFLGVSPLAREAHTCGLVDLRDALPRAIARAVRAAACDAHPFGQPLPYHQRVAAMYATRRQGVRVTLDRGVARIFGSLGRGVGISENRGSSILHVRRLLPETVCAAMAGRELSTIVEAPLLAGEPLPIRSAERRGEGLSVAFRTPDAILSRDGVAALLSR
ncbi:hypothetical protein [Sphingomonas sp. TX0522]|uniref:hypothetical protein n=1 Tax=Sphingomonas sp. TX0522 TaxID=2479205 RepID=UPI0018DF04C8|nr:hypothetical protein [Sphingomonas sp. TX0522]MBI0532036.1 hypothetical protein [Sphingomonas sp. TX0522]